MDRAAALLTVSAVLLTTVPTRAQPRGGDKCEVVRFNRRGGAWIGSRRSEFGRLRRVGKQGEVDLYRRVGDARRFAGVPLRHRRYGFVDDLLVFVELRTATFEFSGPAAQGYRSTAHLKVVEHLKKVNGGCQTIEMTRSLHSTLAEACEQRHKVRHCNAPILWDDDPVEVVSIFALAKDGPTANGPHFGFTVVRYQLPASSGGDTQPSPPPAGSD